MFYIIGLGLGDPKDITVKGLEAIKKCDRVYLENYTSILISGQIENLVSSLPHAR
jgi:diphthine methyl ester synthase